MIRRGGVSIIQGSLNHMDVIAPGSEIRRSHCGVAADHGCGPINTTASGGCAASARILIELLYEKP